MPLFCVTCRRQRAYRDHFSVVCPSVCLSVRLSVRPSVSPSVCLSFTLFPSPFTLYQEPLKPFVWNLAYLLNFISAFCIFISCLAVVYWEIRVDYNLVISQWKISFWYFSLREKLFTPKEPQKWNGNKHRIKKSRRLPSFTSELIVPRYLFCNP